MSQATPLCHHFSSQLCRTMGSSDGRVKAEELLDDVKDAAATAQVEHADAVATSVTITFEQPVFFGAIMYRQVIFTKRPLGFEYGPQANPGCCASGSTGRWVVTKITAGVGEVRAIKVGAVILQINGVGGTDKDKPEFDELIKKSVMMLPEA
ncbi:unnamed protein product [Polarella glacialis]|uniref:Uncharacterized protein n=1 Tax=Polarella glacialis TaxID=89957 RepID=A0A813EN12_POLGL|nr:unnamed protein product [Polarella glacialis]